jgi:hypothetical protein
MEAKWLAQETKYLFDWYKYCCELDRYLKENKPDHYKTLYNAKMVRIIGKN